MAELHVFHNDVEWVVAESEADCALAMQESVGADGYYDNIEWYQLADDVDLLIWLSEDDVRPGDEHDLLVIGSMRDWIEYNGRGFLCSTEY